MSAPTADPQRLLAARRRLAAAGVVVVYEDHLVLGIAKAAGVLSQRGPQGEDSLVEAIDAYRREAEGKAGRAFVGLVHRLDRNVSGAMVLAKSSKAASRLSASFRGRDGVEKHYLAWVAGRPERDEATLRSVLVRDVVARRTRARDAAADGSDDEEAAVLAYRVEGRGEAGARLHVRLGTGQTHQIRVQLARAGIPILGDAKYGGPVTPERARCERVALHARRLVVPHPVGGAPVVIEAPVPDELVRLDRALAMTPPVG